MKNKVNWIIGIVVIVVLIVIGLSLNSGTDGDEPLLEADRFSFATQSVGEVTDKLEIKSVRHADHPLYYRFVFDLVADDGVSNPEVIPSTRATYNTSSKTIELLIGGIRKDNSGNKVSEFQVVDSDPVSGFVRKIV